ncbi:MAG: TonB-dependent receptor [Rhodothermales bacterium]
MYFIRTKEITPILVVVLGLFLLPDNLFAQTAGTLEGRITDKQTGEPLPGANVQIAGTTIGTAADIDGFYRLLNMATGAVEIRVSYLGYLQNLATVNINAGETVVHNVQLAFGVIEGEEILVTAQAAGQVAAINQQLGSNTITNVVSAERIQELPDQNAAESVGRLPGISIERDAGEGQKVIIRGLSPKFNAITVNGERMPSTDGNDRSVDLSMISPDVLAGIEVSKALTPNMDADAIGGTVNLITRRAQSGLQGNVRLQTGYNDHQGEYGQFKGGFSASNRIFRDKLGIVGTGSFQRADRSSDVLDAGYIFARESDDGGIISVNSLNLGDRLETRDRYTGGLIFDYDLPRGTIMLNNFAGYTERDEIRRRKRYRIGSAYTEYDLRDRNINQYLYTTALSGTHDFQKFNISWLGSFARTLQKTPFSNTSRFRELAAFTGDLIEDQGPELIPLGAKSELERTWFFENSTDRVRVTDSNLAAKVDLTIPFNVNGFIAGEISTGAKIRDKTRSRNSTRFRSPFGELNDIGQENTDTFDLYQNQRISISNFLDSSFDPGAYLNGQYDFGPGLDIDALNGFTETFRSRYVVDLENEAEDYEAGETVQAGYLMAEINLGPKVMLLPGVRYERTNTDYSSFELDGEFDDDGFFRGQINRITGGRDYDEILPMVHLRYKVTPQFDIRLAYTKSLARPNYFNLVPWERIVIFNNTIERGNPDLKHTVATNYDVYASLYTNRFGLLTVGGFYKKLDNIDYLSVTRLQGGEFGGFELTQPVNAEGESTVYGVEFDVQTNFRWLPAPFDGLLLNANYTYIFSETFFPFFEIGPRSPDPPFAPTLIDTVRAGRMPGQSDGLFNISLGYEKGGFSGRVSILYQGISLETIGTRSELDGFQDDYVRWDAAINQRISTGFTAFFNLNNFTNRAERAFLGARSFATNEEYFGWTVDLGVRYKF